VADAMAAMKSDTDEVYPPGAPMTFWRLQAERQALADRLRYLDSLRVVCASCQHWTGTACRHFGETPPGDFQKTEGACNEWVSDGVPF